MTTLLALSIAIMAGLLVSRFIKLVHMPNVTAFLIGGLLIGPSVLGILSQEMTDSLSIITEAALGFIAYSIGAEFKLSYLKRIGTKPVVITLRGSGRGAGGGYRSDHFVPVRRTRL